MKKLVILGGLLLFSCSCLMAQSSENTQYFNLNVERTPLKNYNINESEKNCNIYKLTPWSNKINFETQISTIKDEEEWSGFLNDRTSNRAVTTNTKKEQTSMCQK